MKFNTFLQFFPQGFFPSPQTLVKTGARYSSSCRIQVTSDRQATTTTGQFVCCVRPNTQTVANSLSSPVGPERRPNLLALLVVLTFYHSFSSAPACKHFILLVEPGGLASADAGQPSHPHIANGSKLINWNWMNLHLSVRLASFMRMCFVRVDVHTAQQQYQYHWAAAVRNATIYGSGCGSEK